MIFKCITQCKHLKHAFLENDSFKLVGKPRERFQSSDGCKFNTLRGICTQKANEFIFKFCILKVNDEQPHKRSKKVNQQTKKILHTSKMPYFITSKTSAIMIHSDLIFYQQFFFKWQFTNDIPAIPRCILISEIINVGTCVSLKIKV